jgi:tetratricopeptide (TPR) repeat protein
MSTEQLNYEDIMATPFFANMFDEEQHLPVDAENNDHLDAIGINALTDIFIKKTKIITNIDNNEKRELLLNAVEINPYSSWANEEVAIYLECTEKNYTDAEQYYLQAYELDPNNITILYNFATYYKQLYNETEMIKYFKMAADNGDAESFLILSEYYKNNSNQEEMLKNLLQAIELGFDNDEDDEDKDNEDDKENKEEKNDGFYHLITKNFDSKLALIKLIECEGVLTKNQTLLINKLKTEPCALVFNNKVRLFSKLQNITECGICLDTKLNIDLHCGHEVCCDCYVKVHTDKCPFCRTKVFYY